MPLKLNFFQPLMLNTLGVRSALGVANRRKLSFRNVSNVVVQLLHTIKYSVPVPFSNVVAQPYPGSSATGGAAGVFIDKNARKVRNINNFILCSETHFAFCKNVDENMSKSTGLHKICS